MPPAGKEKAIRLLSKAQREVPSLDLPPPAAFSVGRQDLWAPGVPDLMGVVAWVWSGWAMRGVPLNPPSHAWNWEMEGTVKVIQTFS